MSLSRDFAGVVGLWGALALSAFGCQSEHKSLSAAECKPHCGTPASGTLSGGGGAGQGGDSGSGATGGVVDVTGSVVAFNSLAFDIDDTVPYTGAIRIIAPGSVEADAKNGEFELPDIDAGSDWIYAQNSDGASGGPYSTFSYQLFGNQKMLVPVVPSDLLDAVASQLGAASLASDRGHLILVIVDKTGQPLPDVEVTQPSGSTLGYDIAPGQYSTNVTTTGTLGMVVILNAQVGSGAITLSLQSPSDMFSAVVQLGPNAATYSFIQAP